MEYTSKLITFDHISRQQNLSYEFTVRYSMNKKPFIPSGFYGNQNKHFRKQISKSKSVDKTISQIDSPTSENVRCEKQSQNLSRADPMSFTFSLSETSLFPTRFFFMASSLHTHIIKLQKGGRVTQAVYISLYRTYPKYEL